MIDLLPYQRALLANSPRIVKPRAVGPTWLDTTAVVRGIIETNGLRVPLTAPEFMETDR